MSTKVSIITPVYNCSKEQYERSADSVGNQSNKSFEWVIVDDGSRIHNFNLPASVYLSANWGPSVARNVGFQIASGDIITYLDMGDELYHDRVDNLIKLYEKYHVALSFTGYNIVYPDTRVDRFNHFDWIGAKYSAIDHIQALQKTNLSIPMGVAHRRKPFVEAGGFQRGIVCGEDGVLWRRMVDKVLPSEIVFTDEIAGNYYVLPDSQARTQRRFEMGGFAINGDLKDNGRYLDESWYNNYSSKEYYE